MPFPLPFHPWQVLDPGLIGGLVLPILGALPDSAMIVMSGLGGTVEEATEQVAVGDLDLQHTTAHYHVTVYCSTLQHTTAHCNTLQHIAARTSYG